MKCSIPFNENADCRYHRTRVMRFFHSHTRDDDDHTHSFIIFGLCQPSFFNPNPNNKFGATIRAARAAHKHTLFIATNHLSTSTQMNSEILIKNFHCSLWTLCYALPFRGGGDVMSWWYELFLGNTHVCKHANKQRQLHKPTHRMWRIDRKVDWEEHTQTHTHQTR